MNQISTWYDENICSLIIAVLKSSINGRFLLSPYHPAFGEELNRSGKIFAVYRDE